MLLTIINTYKPSNLEQRSDYFRSIYLPSRMRPLQRLIQNFVKHIDGAFFRNQLTA